MKSLFLLSQIWQEIFIDFIIDFSESDDCTAMVVVTDWLSKDVIIKFLKNVIVEMTVWMFIKNILALHEPPNTIIFDKKSQFVSDFWERFCKIININRRLSTVYYS